MSTETQIYICPDCNKCHDDQRAQFPEGCRVKARGDIQNPFDMPPVPAGALGTVTAHCDDGRAYVIFDKPHDTAHTFHWPLGYIELTDEPAPEPEPLPKPSAKDQA